MSIRTILQRRSRFASLLSLVIVGSVMLAPVKSIAQFDKNKNDQQKQEEQRKQEEAKKAEEARKADEQRKAEAQKQADLQKQREEQARKQAEEAAKKQEAEAKAASVAARERAEAQKQREEQTRKQAEEAAKKQEAEAKATSFAARERAEAQKQREEKARKQAEEAAKKQEAEAKAPSVAAIERAEAQNQREEQTRKQSEKATKQQEAETKATSFAARERAESQKQRDEQARKQSEEAAKKTNSQPAESSFVTKDTKPHIESKPTVSTPLEKQPQSSTPSQVQHVTATTSPNIATKVVEPPKLVANPTGPTSFKNRHVQTEAERILELQKKQREIERQKAIDALNRQRVRVIPPTEPPRIIIIEGISIPCESPQLPVVSEPVEIPAFSTASSLAQPKPTNPRDIAVNKLGFPVGFAVDYASTMFNRNAPKPGVNWRGEPDEWFANASRAGWKTTTDPKLIVKGSILVWTRGVHGHVAYVEKVTKDGYFVISEMNMGKSIDKKTGMTSGFGIISRTALSFLPPTGTDGQKSFSNSSPTVNPLNRGVLRFEGAILPSRLPKVAKSN